MNWHPPSIGGGVSSLPSSLLASTPSVVVAAVVLPSSGPSEPNEVGGGGITVVEVPSPGVTVHAIPTQVPTRSSPRAAHVPILVFVVTVLPVVRMRRPVYAKPGCGTLVEMDDGGIPRRRRPELGSVESLPQAAALFFRHDSPRLLVVHLGVLLAVRLVHGGLGPGDLLAVVAVAIYWPLQEWVLHIHLLHMRPFHLRGRRVDPFMARIHRAHHREPWNLDFVFLPVKVLLPLIPLNALLWWLAVPSTGPALTGMTAMAAAALLYEWVHYLTHTPYRPRSRYYRSIWRGHRLHHFKNERYWHAFTVPLVDTLLGTNPDPRTVEQSATCRDLDGRA